MRKVISNTTPILSLLKINKLDLLRNLFGSITIPAAVFEEIENGKDKDFYTDLIEIDWIKIEKIQSLDLKSYIFDLDEGELEVLILAREQNADLVILDELTGRRYAQQLNLNITGTLGILLKSKELGFVRKVTPLLNELMNKGTWLNPKLVTRTIELAKE